jgi:hypothetical protein
MKAVASGVPLPAVEFSSTNRNGRLSGTIYSMSWEMKSAFHSLWHVLSHPICENMFLRAARPLAENAIAGWLEVLSFWRFAHAQGQRSIECQGNEATAAICVTWRVCWPPDAAQGYSETERRVSHGECCVVNSPLTCPTSDHGRLVNCVVNSPLTCPTSDHGRLVIRARGRESFRCVSGAESGRAWRPESSIM